MPTRRRRGTPVRPPCSGGPGTFHRVQLWFNLPATYTVRRASRCASSVALRSGEPVAQHDPLVVNTRLELVQTVKDHQQGRFRLIPLGALMPRMVR